MARKMFVLVAALLPVAGGAAVLLPRDGDALGRLAAAKLPGETVSYAYNVRNALTSISSPRFSQQLRYAAGASAPCYNGNIAEAVTQGNRYAYTYDNANRLTAAKYTDAGAGPRYVPNYSTTYAYDRNSNITSLTRYGQTGINTWGKIDDLTMTYDGNRLSKVEDAADEVLLETSRDIKPIDPGIGDFIGLPQFSYDTNGNTVRDITRNLYGVTYNALNLPQSATISSESSKLVMPSDASRIDYTYDGAGVKHQTVHTTVTKYTLGNKVITRTKRDTTRYVGSRIYENGRLDRVLTPYGYIKDGVHHTFLHDYQGNVAAVVAGDSLVQRTSYYPYGLPHANAHGATANPYKYSGKEFDTFGGTDLYDFHARHHAPSTGRFMTPDPLAEDYYGYSIYLYCMGNPIALIDPSGLGAFWHNGTEIGTDGINDGKIFALKTTESSFTEGEHAVPGAGLSKDALKATISFIKSNSGNSEAFQNNSIAYDNSVQIESSAENRQIMVDEVSRDNGKGGTKPDNNREYGGAIIDGFATPQSPGPVTNPGAGESGEFYTSFGVPTFHSHPSGIGYQKRDENKGVGSSTTIGNRQTSIRGYYQIPSLLDLNSASPGTMNYVFGRYNQKVYIYNNNGVQAVIPMKHFVTPKKTKK